MKNIIILNTKYRTFTILFGALVLAAGFTLLTDNDPYNFIVRYALGLFWVSLMTSKLILKSVIKVFE